MEKTHGRWCHKSQWYENGLNRACGEAWNQSSGKGCRAFLCAEQLILVGTNPGPVIIALCFLKPGSPGT